MITENVITRAELLFQQKKYSDAEKLLKDLLATNPNDVHVLILLAETSLQLDKIEQASRFVDSAIGIDPQNPVLFYIKSRLAISNDKYDDAETHIRQSIDLDPSDPDYYALWSSVKHTRKQFTEALSLADRALELDPENILALNIRSSALLKLDKKDESYKTIEGALREDPNNPYTHANYGWNLLEKRDHKKALEHFREALKADPNFQYAQAGMVEALKASNIVYRLFLRYAFWMNNLTAKYQWGVIVGFYLGFRGLKALAANNAALQPYLTPLIVLLGIVAFSTWVITPLSNLLFRINKYGKYLLDKKEITSSNLVGISFIVFVAALAGYFILANDLMLVVAAYGFAMMVPLGVMFSPSRNQSVLVIYAVVMGLVGLAAIVIAFTTSQIFNVFTPVFLFAFIGFQWVANYFLIRDSNR
jgi:tetratricopeptide (TPR) repeat protein